MKQNIAFIAVKRYLSNVLTDFEKTKSIMVFLNKIDFEISEFKKADNIS